MYIFLTLVYFLFPVPTGGISPVSSTSSTASKFKSKLQVVTQTLHIPPSAESTVETNSNNELEKLRKEVKKLREYARLSVQDRKILIHKIGTLKDKVHETSSRKSASPLRYAFTSWEVCFCESRNVEGLFCFLRLKKFFVFVLVFLSIWNFKIFFKVDWDRLAKSNKMKLKIIKLFDEITIL